MSNHLVLGTSPDDYDEPEEPDCFVCNDTGQWEVEPGTFVDCYMGCRPSQMKLKTIQVIEHPEIAGVDW